MEEKTFEIQATFVFSGIFTIRAYNQAEAREYVEKHCGLVLGGDIHTTLPEGKADWNFGHHPQKRIRHVRAIK